MKKVSFILLFAVSFFLASNLIHAQEKENRIGIGVSIGRQIIEEMEYRAFEYTRFYVPIIVSSHFRLEPEIGYYRYSGSGEDWKESRKRLSIGCGIFFITRKGKVDIYYGARLGLISTSYFYETTTYLRDESRTDFYIGPAIGGEYFFSNHFSLGGEIQINHISIGQWSDEIGDASESIIRIKPLVFVRWYF